MGTFMSRLSALSNTMMMNTQQKVQFQREYGRTLETAKAAGQLQALQQVNLAGGGGGGGGSSAATGARAFGSFNISSWLYTATPMMMFLFIVLGLFSFFFRLGTGAMFAAVSGLSFFALHAMMWLAPSQQGGTLNFRNIGMSFVLSLVIGAFAGFFLYPLGTDEPTAAPPVVVAQQQPLQDQAAPKAPGGWY